MRTIHFRRRAAALVGLAAAAGLTLTACSSGSADSASTGSAKSGALKIAFVTKPLDNTYFGAMVTGAQAAAKELGVSVNVQAAQNVSDDSGQASKLNAMVSEGYGCYVLNPTSPTNLITPLASIKNDAPIVNIDLEMDLDAAKAQGVNVDTYIGTVNEDAGENAGKALLKQVPEGSKVAVIGTLAQDAGNIARQKGFHNVVDGKLDTVQTVSADADRVKAKNAAASIMRANPEVKGFFTPAGTQAIGIQEAIEQEGRSGDVKVVGIDGTDEELQSIIDGKLASTVEQFPYLMGYQAVQACIAGAGGKTLPERVDTPVLIVDKSNAQAALDASPAPPKDFEVPDPFSS